MAFSGTKGYSSYRGRGNKGKIFLAILLILIILVSVGFIIAREHMTYDAEGNLHFPWPWGQTESEGTPPPEIPDGDVTIQEPDSDPKQEALTEPIRAVQLGSDPAEWQTALTGDYNAFAVTMKAGGGTLCYPFETTAAGRRVSAQATDAKEALTALLDGERYSIARLSCLRDGGVARENLESMGLENTGGYVFYDGNNENWLDPGKAGTVSYLTALARECADLGFDEILLTDLTYPTVGKLDKIAYTLPDGEPEGAQAEVLASLLAEIRDALPEGVALSLELDADTIRAGGNEIAGQKLTELAPIVDRIYAVTTENVSPALVEAVVAASPSCLFVPELTEQPTDQTASCLLRLK